VRTLLRIGVFLVCFAVGLVAVGLSCFRFMESTPPHLIIIGYSAIILWFFVSYYLAKNVTLPGSK
jgi:hypothetical protein